MPDNKSIGHYNSNNFLGFLGGTVPSCPVAQFDQRTFLRTKNLRACNYITPNDIVGNPLPRVEMWHRTLMIRRAQ